jgi:hypothetical protein
MSTITGSYTDMRRTGYVMLCVLYICVKSVNTFDVYNIYSYGFFFLLNFVYKYINLYIYMYLNQSMPYAVTTTSLLIYYSPLWCST